MSQGHPPPSPIGTILRENGAITDAQLDQALDQQARMPQARLRLGEVCVLHGWCGLHDVARALLQQHEALFRATTLGHLLLDQGHIALPQLEGALAAQDDVGAPLGEVLVQRGACTEEQVEAARELQARRRTAAVRRLAAADFGAINVTEIIVNQELDAILGEEGACTCDACRADALALALNSIPSRYVSDQRLLLLFIERFRAESLDLIRQRTRLAVRRVKQHPHAACGRSPMAAEAPPTEVPPRLVPVRAVERHVHPSQAHVQRLFGAGAELTSWHPTSQPGYFAARQTVQVAGPRGTLERVRVIGPPAEHTRVELTGPDLFVLGHPEEEGETPISLWGPKGSVEHGLTVRRIEPHVHASAAQAARLGMDEGGAVQVRVRGERPRVLRRVPIVVADEARLECHLGADQAASAGLRADTQAELLACPESPSEG
ncbi:MAG: PduL/EutD family phosphate acyltransferase [Candidatus Brocadiia bacterium]